MRFIKNIISAEAKAGLLWCLAVQAQGPVGALAFQAPRGTRQETATETRQLAATEKQQAISTSGTVARLSPGLPFSGQGEKAVETTHAIAILSRRIQTVVVVLGVVLGGLALVSPSSALAAAPSLFLESFTATNATTEAFEGGVNPGGESTTYHVAYDLKSAEWCTSSGVKGSPAHSTTPVSLGFTDTKLHHVAVEVKGLGPGGEYCAELIAANGASTVSSEQLTFTAGAPSIANFFAAGSTSASTETVEALIDPAGQSTTYHVAYDLASSEWCTSSGTKGSPAHSTTPVLSGFTGTLYRPVSVELSGLSGGTGYCAEMIAVNGSAAVGVLDRFTAGLPSTLSFRGRAIDATTQMVEGYVNPSGQSTTYDVVYDLKSSEWCMSGGSKGSPAHSTMPVTLGFTDATLHTVSVSLGGLTAGTEYCAAIAGTNGSGTSQIYPVRFTAGAPLASITLHNEGEGAYNVFATGATTATVQGEVYPAGQATEYKVAYDLASSEWCMSGGSKGSPQSTTPVPLGFTDTAFHPVSVGLSGLTAGSEYCVELIAVNSSASGHEGFPVSFTAGLPYPYPLGSFATSTTTATVEAELNPAGQSTTYHVVYDLASSEWCTSFGREGSPAHSTTPVTLGFTDGTFHPISIGLSGLTAGAEYCAEFVAVNGSGTVQGGGSRFTAGWPSAFTFEASATGATTANVEGEVNPAGQATEYHVVYDLKSSEWCTSFGREGSPAHSTTPVTLGFTDGTFHPVSVGLSGLAAGSEYCAELIAVNGSGTVHGGDVSFTAGAAPKPIVTKVTPASGTNAGGTAVTITGAGLEAARAVDFGGAAATIKTDTATEITVESPAHAAGQIDVTVTTLGGTSATTEADHYTYEAPPPNPGSPTVTPSSTGSGTPPAGPSQPAPILAQRQSLSVASGVVTVRLKGTAVFVPLSSVMSVPDGSEVDATNGRVVVTVATPRGKTVSAEVYGGRFRVHQDSSGETHFILTLPLTGCPKVTLPHGAAARLAKHGSGPKSRHLWVSEGGGSWGTSGRYVSTTVEGTTWLTLDECTRSEVKVTAGKVSVLNLVRRKTTTVSAGHSYVAATKRRRHA
jgi:hypothetical protein